MATTTEPQAPGVEAQAPPVVEPAAPEQWYDRSSIAADAMVMIADQSPEDFERYAPETRFCDYLDGVIYLPSPASDEHQDLVGFLFTILNSFRFARGTGVVRLGPAVLRLGARRKPEPDIFVLPAEAPATAPAVLVIEVLSRSTRAHDLGRKLTAYRDAGIPEIWLFDDRDRSVIVERRVGEGYHREHLTEGRLISSSLPGFWLDLAWLWTEPLPDPMQCLAAILAGLPA